MFTYLYFTVHFCFVISDKAAEILNSAGALDYVIKTMEKYTDILCKLQISLVYECLKLSIISLFEFINKI